MDILLVVLLLVIGAILLVIEFLLLPGVTVAGFIGITALVGGIVLSYIYFGTLVGHLVLAIIVLLAVAGTVLFLRHKTWQRLSLTSTITGAVAGIDGSIRLGDIGKTIGRLAPMGKVIVQNQVVEAQSEMGYIDPNKEVIVTKILRNKIIVKLKTVNNDVK